MAPATSWERPLPPVTAADVARTPGYRSGANTGGHATPTLSHTPRGAQTPTHPYQHRRDGGESGGGAMADYYLSPASFAAAADAAAASFASSFASSSPPSYASVTTPMQQQGGGSGAAAARGRFCSLVQNRAAIAARGVIHYKLIVMIWG